MSKELERPAVPNGYSFCGMFKTKKHATGYAHRYKLMAKCPVLVTYNTGDKMYTVWKQTTKGAKKGTTL